MSIYIKGMEMPKSCGKCKLFDVSHAIGLFAPLGWCRVNGKEIFGVSEKADFCPLILVPPHGRLIDGDELAAGCDEPHWCRWLSEIEDAPTIIPAEKEG